MILGFADALRRRLEPAWPVAAALRLLAFGLAGLYDAAFDMRNVDRVVEPRAYFFLPFFFFFFAVLAFFAFFAMLPS
jgi:hypothetical protein